MSISSYRMGMKPREGTVLESQAGIYHYLRRFTYLHSNSAGASCPILAKRTIF